MVRQATRRSQVTRLTVRKITRASRVTVLTAEEGNQAPWVAVLTVVGVAQDRDDGSSVVKTWPGASEMAVLRGEDCAQPRPDTLSPSGSRRYPSSGTSSARPRESDLKAPSKRVNEGKPTNGPQVDHELLAMGLRMTPTQRLRWLEDAVEELLPWTGSASRSVSESERS